jgi:cytochrome c553
MCGFPAEVDMGKKARYLVTGLLLIAAGQVMADGNAPEAGQTALCMACHGSDGNSPEFPPLAEQVPKIAGQIPEYIVKQLYDFKSGRRSNGQMSLQVRNVADVDIANIAAFFAAQRVKPNVATNKSLLARGENLFLRGRGRPEPVAACVGCHRKNGDGQRDWPKNYTIAPAVLAPAIGGQHARYVVKQLKAFRDGSRSNDAGRVMYNIARHLDDGDIEAVAEYMTTLVY